MSVKELTTKHGGSHQPGRRIFANKMKPRLSAALLQGHSAPGLSGKGIQAPCNPQLWLKASDIEGGLAQLGVRVSQGVLVLI